MVAKDLFYQREPSWLPLGFEEPELSINKSLWSGWPLDVGSLLSISKPEL